DIHARRIEAGQAEQREIALHLPRPEFRRGEREVMPQAVKAPARVLTTRCADDAGAVECADRDATDGLEEDRAAKTLRLVHQLEQRSQRAALVGAERTAALQQDPNLDGLRDLRHGD